MKVFNRLWSDEAGFVVSSELVLIATIMVIGLIAGMTTLRDQVVAELADVANAIGTVTQSYSFSGLTGHSSSTAGTTYTDLRDFCDTLPTAGAFADCVSIIAAAPAET